MNWRRRFYFECPICGHKSNFARQTKYSFTHSEFKCDSCNATITAKRGLLFDMLLGLILGAIFCGLAYVAFVTFLSNYPPVVSVLVAAPFMIVLTYYVFGPMYSKWTLRWVVLNRPKS